ncbi:hypothetical protein EIN_046650 [Entamoeba invadens IP1]|uniref:UBX domain-containing protein n=1 Tax=Entamoeba invadens IP1 TaxID=370355 RepID=A0A0A1UG49_ENTIV|nr:hypothetical protein EIN_046650 [Entamoeba invadens IP1]ELP94412.1 hypothetical protein EIN_046650 [Entamoeba invadens IP1]|eukprot:XP_004261183.1 hypothetical protein EIN_046650 [Entamoeba invadens IP1]
MSIHWSTPSGVPDKVEENPIEPTNFKLDPALFDVKVLLPKTTPTVITGTELPDAVYEMTASDVRAICLENAVEVFKTKTFMEKQRLERNTKYKKTTIKFKFPDNLEVSRNFHPLEFAEDLYVFIKESMKCDGNFVIRLGVGKRDVIACDKQSLASLNLVPGAVLLVTIQNFKTITKPYLKDDLLNIATQRP